MGGRRWMKVGFFSVSAGGLGFSASGKLPDHHIGFFHTAGKICSFDYALIYPLTGIKGLPGRPTFR